MKSKKFFCIILLILVTVSVFSEPKNALLIANGDYKNFSSLANPIPESSALADTLRQLGFNVMIKTNLSLEEMQLSLVEFEAKVKLAGGVAFFHYGGHAVQVGGSNYLIPADADIESESRVKARALDLDEVMSSMRGDTNIVILDACRNNPLPAGEGRSATRGLTPVKYKPRNSIIVYSAQAGSVAVDGVFTPVLTDKITEPKSFTNIIRDVRKEVGKRTKNKQKPGSYDELDGEIYLAGTSQNTKTATAAKVSKSTAAVKNTIPDDFVFVEGGPTCWSFYICDHEVTQAEYKAVMGDNYSKFNGDNNPVENVSWYDAIEYCNLLSRMEGLTPCYTINKMYVEPSRRLTQGEYIEKLDYVEWRHVEWDRLSNGYRLPTENEWEWAAKGGNKSKGCGYSGSNNIDEVAWYSDNSDNHTHPVKGKMPNELGIYDMSGNVWEWCWSSDPTTYRGGNDHYTRGGSWDYILKQNDYGDDYETIKKIPITFRWSAMYGSSTLGFRVVRSAK